MNYINVVIKRNTVAYDVTVITCFNPFMENVWPIHADDHYLFLDVYQLIKDASLHLEFVNIDASLHLEFVNIDASLHLEFVNIDASLHLEFVIINFSYKTNIYSNSKFKMHQFVDIYQLLKRRLNFLLKISCSDIRYSNMTSALNVFSLEAFSLLRCGKQHNFNPPFHKIYLEGSEYCWCHLICYKPETLSVHFTLKFSQAVVGRLKPELRVQCTCSFDITVWVGLLPRSVGSFVTEHLISIQITDFYCLCLDPKKAKVSKGDECVTNYMEGLDCGDTKHIGGAVVYSHRTELNSYYNTSVECKITFKVENDGWKIMLRIIQLDIPDLNHKGLCNDALYIFDDSTTLTKMQPMNKSVPSRQCWFREVVETWHKIVQDPASCSEYLEFYCNKTIDQKIRSVLTSWSSPPYTSRYSYCFLIRVDTRNKVNNGLCGKIIPPTLYSTGPFLTVHFSIVPGCNSWLFVIQGDIVKLTSHLQVQIVYDMILIAKTVYYVLIDEKIENTITTVLKTPGLIASICSILYSQHQRSQVVVLVNSYNIKNCFSKEKKINIGILISDEKKPTGLGFKFIVTAYSDEFCHSLSKISNTLLLVNCLCLLLTFTCKIPRNADVITNRC
ncbi:hypothetical protein KUTeg_019485 [Tegillarca granosa]|uniref:CUB domain-containing protein n=1 Tax=Tegillarca granosa TaxID=220873 RepID=A0ABQ9EER6_TEGGR|nr:hypothetical protein KUTeg_019485 [Tegillarca granosa]